MYEKQSQTRKSIEIIFSEELLSTDNEKLLLYLYQFFFLWSKFPSKQRSPASCFLYKFLSFWQLGQTYLAYKSAAEHSSNI